MARQARTKEGTGKRHQGHGVTDRIQSNRTGKGVEPSGKETTKVRNCGLKREKT